MKITCYKNIEKTEVNQDIPVYVSINGTTKNVPYKTNIQGYINVCTPAKESIVSIYTKTGVSIFVSNGEDVDIDIFDDYLTLYSVLRNLNNSDLNICDNGLNLIYAVSSNKLLTCKNLYIPASHEYDLNHSTIVSTNILVYGKLNTTCGNIEFKNKFITNNPVKSTGYISFNGIVGFLDTKDSYFDRLIITAGTLHLLDTFETNSVEIYKDCTCDIGINKLILHKNIGPYRGMLKCAYGTIELKGKNNLIYGNNRIGVLIKKASETDALSFQADTTQEIKTELILTGKIGVYLSLNSFGGHQWNIMVPEKNTLHFLNVKNCTKLGEHKYDKNTLINNGNNTNWTFLPNSGSNRVRVN